jgi:hypothetical protein
MQYGRNTSGPKKNRLARVLTSPDKGIGRTYGANGVLSRLFRQILFDLNIAPIRFGQLMQEYLLDPSNGVPPNKKDQTSMRGNLTKEFSREQMTWKVFCKALRFLQFLRVELVLRCHHRNGTISEHKTDVLLRTADEDEGVTFEDQLNQPESQEALGDYIPVLDDQKQQEAEMGKATQSAVLPNPAAPLSVAADHWYAWSASSKLIYEDLGNGFAEHPTPQQLMERFGEKVRAWQKLDSSVQLSQGVVVQGNATAYYARPQQ